MNKQMKTFPLTVVTALLVVAAYGQGQQHQPKQGQTGIVAITRALAAHVPEISDDYEVKNESHTNYLWYYTTGMDEYGLEANKKLQIYRYERPASASDLVVVSYFNELEEPSHPGLRWFEYNRQTGVLKEARQPFTIPLPVAFNKKLEADNYWRMDYQISSDGNILINANPDMNGVCIAAVCWNKTKGDFTFYKRGVFVPVTTVGEDNATAEQYVRDIVRPNYQRINNITNWTYTEEKERFDMALENALLTYYYSGNELEKIVARFKGEPYSCVIEYYLLDGHLSFIHDITRYTASGETVERRWYFRGDTCIRGLGDKGEKMTPTQIKEEFLGNEEREIILYISILTTL